VKVSHHGKFIPLFEADYYLDPETVRDAVKNRGMFNLIQNKYVIKIDSSCARTAPTDVENSPGEEKFPSTPKIFISWRRKI